MLFSVNSAKGGANAGALLVLTGGSITLGSTTNLWLDLVLDFLLEGLLSLYRLPGFIQLWGSRVIPLEGSISLPGSAAGGAPLLGLVAVAGHLVIALLWVTWRVVRPDRLAAASSRLASSD